MSFTEVELMRSRCHRVMVDRHKWHKARLPPAPSETARTTEKFDDATTRRDGCPIHSPHSEASGLWAMSKGTFLRLRVQACGEQRLDPMIEL